MGAILLERSVLGFAKKSTRWAFLSLFRPLLVDRDETVGESEPSDDDDDDDDVDDGE